MRASCDRRLAPPAAGALANECLDWTYVGSVRGERNVSIDNMCRLAWALGAELPDLLRPLK